MGTEQIPSPAQDTTPTPLREALEATTGRYQRALDVALRADQLLVRLSAFARVPSDVNRELLAAAVAMTRPAVQTVLEEAGLVPASVGAFARYELTAADEAALASLAARLAGAPRLGPLGRRLAERGAPRLGPLARRLAERGARTVECPQCGRERIAALDGAAVRCFACKHDWLPAAPGTGADVG
jgi:hypothetical protein